MKFGVELVGKIGSMALLNSDKTGIDTENLKRLCGELRPGMIWVSSGATEIGRLDYIKRAGKELSGKLDEIKTDYASQGQSVLMQLYRRYTDPAYSVRQLLVEHHHFNDESKREHIKNFLLRAGAQGAIPVINYNDSVSFEENRKMEIQSLRSARARVVELVDNDETAAQIACLVHARVLLILTGVDGIYSDPGDPSTLIERITGKNADEVAAAIAAAQANCRGSSRAGANGAWAKLEYIKEPVMQGTRVIIANAKCAIADILSGAARSTVIEIL